MQIITRPEAKEKGLSHYYTGKPCKHGHVSNRRTDNGDCLVCARERCSAADYKNYKAGWYRDNKQQVMDAWRKRYTKNRSAILEKQNAYYQRNKEWILKHQSEYYHRNKDKIREKINFKYAALPQHKRDEIQRKNKEWKANNPEKYALAKKRWAEKNYERLKATSAAHSRTRQAKKRMACPDWVKMDEIKNIYLVRQDISDATGVEYHVDHYYPLQGKTICGLHVPWNLQVIPARENIAKGNKMPEDFYGANHTMIPALACTMSQS